MFNIHIYMLRRSHSTGVRNYNQFFRNPKYNIIDGWECTFDERYENYQSFGLHNSESLGSLLVDFFQFVLIFFPTPPNLIILLQIINDLHT
jgi:hypothetical protein